MKNQTVYIILILVLAAIMEVITFQLEWFTGFLRGQKLLIFFIIFCFIRLIYIKYKN